MIPDPNKRKKRSIGSVDFSSDERSGLTNSEVKRSVNRSLKTRAKIAIARGGIYAFLICSLGIGG